jgi:hypothetical protein
MSYIVFEIQSPDSKKFPSPYVHGKRKDVESAVKQIFEFLNKMHINFIVKEGPQLTQLTSNSVLPYSDFFKAYAFESHRDPDKSF